MALTLQDKKIIFEQIGNECNKAVSTAKNLLHAPEACCMVEALTILACCTKDPSLRSVERSEAFKHLRTPGSFKASLYQIINSMCNAFRVAHNSMERIQLSLSGMPDLLNDLMEATNNLEEEDSQDIIDNSLAAVGRSANKCVKSAKDADDEFIATLEVIEELLQAALATQGHSEHRTEAAKIELQEQKLLKIQKEKLLKDLKQQEEEQKIIVKEAIEDYKTRMSQSTDFTSVVGAMFLDNLNTLILSVGKTSENMGAIVGSIPAGLIDVFKNQINSSKTYFNKDDLMSQAMEGVLFELLEDIVKAPTEEVAANVDVHINNLKAANTYKTVSEMGKMLRKTSRNLIEALQTLKRNEPDCQINYEAAKVAVNLNLKAYEKVNEQNDDNIQESNSKAPKLMGSEERQVLMKTRLDNLKIARQNKDAERELHEKLKKEKILADEKLCEIITKMERLETEEVDLKDVVHYLREGIQQLSKVQIAWGNIVTFFNHIKNSVDNSLMLHIEGITTNVEQISENQQTSLSTLKRRILLREVTKACAVANVLMQSAEIYKTVHNNFVKPTIEKSIVNIALTQEEAQARQYNIVSNFTKIKDAVEDTIETYTQSISDNVYEAMKAQGFEITRAIEGKKTARTTRVQLDNK